MCWKIGLNFSDFKPDVQFVNVSNCYICIFISINDIVAHRWAGEHQCVGKTNFNTWWVFLTSLFSQYLWWKFKQFVCVVMGNPKPRVHKLMNWEKWASFRPLNLLKNLYNTHKNADLLRNQKATNAVPWVWGFKSRNFPVLQWILRSRWQNNWNKMFKSFVVTLSQSPAVPPVQ